MTTVQKLKVVHAIAVFKVEIDAKTTFELESKRRTSVYHDSVMELPKEQRRGSVAPFILQVEGTVDTGLAWIREHALHDDDPIVLAFTNYHESLQQEPSAAKRTQRLLADWRYFRYGTTWAKSRSMVEIGLSPIASKEATALLPAIIALMEIAAAGHQKHGVAPKSQLELRLEGILRSLGVWR
jgi:hypothetical protein